MPLLSNIARREIVVRRPVVRRLTFLWQRGSATSQAIRVRLIAAGAGVEIHGAFFARNNDHLAIDIDVIHEAPKTTSRVILRGLVAGRGQAKVHERAVLMKGARGAETHVEAKAMLLSDQARAEMEPYLEIDEDDVRATHSASVRPLEEEELFYIMSRGLDRKDAETLLLEAFFAPVREALKKFSMSKSLPRRQAGQFPTPLGEI